MNARRVLGKFSATLLAGSLVFAGLHAAPAQAASKTNLLIYTFGDVFDKKIYAPYLATHKNITFTFKSFGDPSTLKSSLTAILQSPTGQPDIVAMEIADSGYYRQYPQYFTDLRKYGADKIKSNFVPGRWAQGISKDGKKVIGIPTDFGGLAVAYRFDLFKKAGLPYKRDAVSQQWSTWAKFIEFGKKYMTKTKSSKKKKWFMDEGVSAFEAILNQGKERFYKPNGTLDFSNKNAQAAFNTTAALLKAGVSARVSPRTNDWYSSLTSDTFAVSLAPAWNLEYFKSKAPKAKGKWDVAKIPGGGGNIGGTQLGIPISSAHKSQAFDFIKWYLAPAQQLTAFKKQGLFPSAKVLYSNSAIKGYKDKYFNGAPTGVIYAQSASQYHPPTYGPKDAAIVGAFGQALQAIAAKPKTNVGSAWSQALNSVRKITH